MFDDDKYIKQFKENQIYPKIHDDIFHLASNTEGNNVLDIGCCYGLLSHRLSKKFNVTGIEANEHYCEKAIYNNIINMKINYETLSEFKDILLDHKIDIVVCRRVIPELYDCGGETLIRKIEKTLYECNVKYIILEGRTVSKRSVHKLKSIDNEIEILSNDYFLDKKYKRCARLQRKEK